MRLAVEPDAAGARLAVLDRRGVRALPPLSLALSLSPPSLVSVADAVAGVVEAVAAGDRPDELVVVYPPHWTTAAVRSATARLAGCAASVRAASAALAAATELAARTPLPPGPLAVLHADPAGVTVSVLAGARAEGVLACRRLPGVGPPDALAAVTATAGLPPYALTGGVLLLAPDPAPWLTPLAELVGEPPLAPPDADRLAVLGALRPPRRAHTGPLRRAVLPTRRAEADPPLPAARPPTVPMPVASPDTPPSDTSPADALAAGLLAPPRTRRRIGTALAAVLVPVLAAAASGLVMALLTQAPGNPGPMTTPDVRGGAVLAQYDYTLRLPAGWQHSGGLPERRRTLLTPAGAPNGSDLISIEQNPLGYDAGAERDRALRELGERFHRARAEGAELTDLGGPVRVGEREFSTYRQRQPLLGAEVDWYVLFERDTQLSVGCQRTRAGAAAVRAACAEVMASVRLRPRVP